MAPLRQKSAGLDAKMPWEGARWRVMLDGVTQANKYCLVVVVLDDLLLEAEEGVGSLAVHQGHVDAEDAEQGVCTVLQPCGFPSRRPAHALGDGVGVWGAASLESLGRDAGDAADLGEDGRVLQGADLYPIQFHV